MSKLFITISIPTIIFFKTLSSLQNTMIRFKWLFEIMFLNINIKTTTSHSTARFLRFSTESFLVMLEIYRRSVWNLFRLENEHLNNCGDFRAVRDISIAPVKDDDITKLEKMMDMSYGIFNRSKKKS